MFVGLMLSLLYNTTRPTIYLCVYARLVLDSTAEAMSGWLAGHCCTLKFNRNPLTIPTKLHYKLY